MIAPHRVYILRSTLNPSCKRNRNKTFIKTDSKQEQLFSGCYCFDHDLCDSIDWESRPLEDWTLCTAEQLAAGEMIAGDLESRSRCSDLWTALCTWHCVCYLFLFIDDQSLLCYPPPSCWCRLYLQFDWNTYLRRISFIFKICLVTGGQDV